MSHPPASTSPPRPPPEPQPYYAPPAGPPEPPPYYPPPPGPPAPPEPPESQGPKGPSKTISILALVFGGAALLMSVIPVAGIFLGGLFGIAAIVLGIIGIFMSHRLFAIIGIVLAVVGLIVAIIVTVAVGRSAEEFFDELPTDSDDMTGEDPGGTGDDQEKKEDEAVDGTDPALPLAAGTVVATGSWQVTFSNIVPDATDAVVAENEFNTPPPEGHQYFMFQIDATFEGEGSRFAWDDLVFGVYLDNALHTEYCGIVPDDLLSAPEVYAGGAVAGNVCVTVPSDGVENAVLSVEEYWVAGPRYFVAIE
jgi:hypothetical protein